MYKKVIYRLVNPINRRDLAESGIPAEYAFDQLMGFLDPLQFGQFA